MIPPWTNAWQRNSILRNGIDYLIFWRIIFDWYQLLFVQIMPRESDPDLALWQRSDNHARTLFHTSSAISLKANYWDPSRTISHTSHAHCATMSKTVHHQQTLIESWGWLFVLQFERSILVHMTSEACESFHPRNSQCRDDVLEGISRLTKAPFEL